MFVRRVRGCVVLIEWKITRVRFIAMAWRVILRGGRT